MEYLILAFALLFGLYALRDLLTLAGVPGPTSTIITFVYCLIVAIYLASESGAINLHGGL